MNRWGEPRQTDDVDATIWSDFGNEDIIIDTLLSQLSGRIEDVAGFAKLHRVLLLATDDRIDVDASLAAFPFERDLIDNATREIIQGCELRICQPSDLIILKAFANRPRDWQDIRGVIIRSGDRLDWERITDELKQLAALKEEPEILETLLDLRQDLSNEPL